MWSEKLNHRKWDGGMMGDVRYRICTIGGFGPCYVTDSVCNAANEEHPRVAGERKSCWNLADTRLISIELLHTESVT